MASTYDERLKRLKKGVAGFKKKHGYDPTAPTETNVVLDATEPFSPEREAASYKRLAQQNAYSKQQNPQPYQAFEDVMRAGGDEDAARAAYVRALPRAIPPQQQQAPQVQSLASRLGPPSRSRVAQLDAHLDSLAPEERAQAAARMEANPDLADFRMYSKYRHMAAAARKQGVLSGLSGVEPYRKPTIEEIVQRRMLATREMKKRFQANDLAGAKRQFLAYPMDDAERLGVSEEHKKAILDLKAMVRGDAAKSISVEAAQKRLDLILDEYTDPHAVRAQKEREYKAGRQERADAEKREKEREATAEKILADRAKKGKARLDATGKVLSQGLSRATKKRDALAKDLPNWKGEAEYPALKAQLDEAEAEVEKLEDAEENLTLAASGGEDAQKQAMADAYQTLGRELPPEDTEPTEAQGQRLPPDMGAGSDTVAPAEGEIPTEIEAVTDEEYAAVETQMQANKPVDPQVILRLRQTDPKRYQALVKLQEEMDRKKQ